MCPHSAYDIVILAPNAALDSYYWLPELRMGRVNRAERVLHTAGGKGHNMARAARRLGGNPLSIGIVGGSSGRFIAAALAEEGIAHDLVWGEMETRRCNTLHTPGGQDTTVILEAGQAAGAESIAAFTQLARSRAGEAPFAVMIGSLPPDFPEDYYARLIQELKPTPLKICLDTGGSPLKYAAQAGPYLIKVNRTEYCAALSTRGKDFNPDSLQHVYANLRPAGVQVLIVTDGPEGAYILHPGGPPFHVRTRVDAWQSTAGAGDTFMAGLLLALNRGESMQAAARYASAAAAANLQEVGCGFFDPQQVEAYLARTTLDVMIQA